MKKRPGRSTLLLIGLLTVAPGMVTAQEAHRFEIEIPFQFILSGRTFDAGKYVFQRLDPAKPHILMLKNTKQGAVRLFVTERVESDQPSATASVVFLRKDGRLYLFQVWAVGEMHGNQLPSLDYDKHLPANDKGSSLVTLKATVP